MTSTGKSRGFARISAALLAAMLPLATPAAGADADRLLGPMKLTRPIAPETVERMFAEAEVAYRARRWSQAMEAFNAIVEFEPEHQRAWLRIGNLHQRRNQLLSAAVAYRKAAQRASTGDPGDEIRTKALLNLASVNVELALAALSDVDRVAAEFAGARDEVGDAALKVKARIEGLQRGRAAASNPEQAGPAEHREQTEQPEHAREADRGGSGARARLSSGRSISGASHESRAAPSPAVDPRAADPRVPRVEIEYLRGAPSP